jgi:HEAT repeat protein
MFQHSSFIRAAIVVSCSVLFIACSNQSRVVRLKSELLSGDQGARDYAVTELGKEAEKGNLDAIRILMASTEDEDVYPSNSPYTNKAHYSISRSQREAAVIALGREAEKGNLEAIRMLIASINNRKVDTSVRANRRGVETSVFDVAEKVVLKIRDPRAVEPLIAVVKRDGHVMGLEEDVLAQIKDPRAVEPLIAALSDGNLWVRAFAAKGLANIKDPRAVEPLIATMNNNPAPELSRYGTPEDVLAAVDALKEIRDPRAVDPLIDFLTKAGSDERWNAVEAATNALRAINDPKGVAVANEWGRRAKIAEERAFAEPGYRVPEPAAEGPGICTCTNKLTGIVLWKRKLSSRKECVDQCPEGNP